MITATPTMIHAVPAVVVGRRTFDVIFPLHGWTYPPELPGVVFTRRPLPTNVPPLVRGMSNVDEIAREFPDAFVDGGAMTIAAFMRAGHISDAEIFTMPVILGSGVRLFQPGPVITGRWDLLETRAFPCGTVKATYRISREGLSRRAQGALDDHVATTDAFPLAARAPWIGRYRHIDVAPLGPDPRASIRHASMGAAIVRVDQPNDAHWFSFIHWRQACASRFPGCADPPSLLRGEGRRGELDKRPVRRAARRRSYWHYASHGR